MTRSVSGTLNLHPIRWALHGSLDISQTQLISQARWAKKACSTQYRWLAALSGLAFRALRIVIFLAIVIWPWQTAE